MAVPVRLVQSDGRRSNYTSRLLQLRVNSAVKPRHASHRIRWKDSVTLLIVQTYVELADRTTEQVFCGFILWFTFLFQKHIIELGVCPSVPGLKRKHWPIFMKLCISCNLVRPYPNLFELSVIRCTNMAAMQTCEVALLWHWNVEPEIDCLKGMKLLVRYYFRKVKRNDIENALHTSLRGY
jgi:hypothetical protein